MADETTQRLARGLPEYYPISAESNNYKLLRAPADQADALDNDIEAATLSLSFDSIQEETLLVEAEETYRVPEEETEYYDKVTVHGTLTIDGALKTNELSITSTDADGAEVINNGTIDIEHLFPERIPYLLRLGKLVGATPRENETSDHYRARVLTEFALSTCEGTIDDVLDTLSVILGVGPSKIEIDDRSGPGRATVTLPAEPLDKQALSQGELTDIVERLLPASYVLDVILSGTFTYITPATYNVNDHDPSRAYDGLDSNGDPEDTGGTYAGLIT